MDTVKLNRIALNITFTDALVNKNLINKSKALKEYNDLFDALLELRDRGQNGAEDYMNIVFERF